MSAAVTSFRPRCRTVSATNSDDERRAKAGSASEAARASSLHTMRPVRRSISLLLYLTPPDWRTEVDGGALRVHRQNAAPLDVEPHAGTLVLFDSASVPHEVLPTRRERTVVVGWLMEDRGD